MWLSKGISVTSSAEIVLLGVSTNQTYDSPYPSSFLPTGSCSILGAALVWPLLPCVWSLAQGMCSGGHCWSCGLCFPAHWHLRPASHPCGGSVFSATFSHAILDVTVPGPMLPEAMLTWTFLLDLVIFLPYFQSLNFPQTWLRYLLQSSPTPSVHLDHWTKRDFVHACSSALHSVPLSVLEAVTLLPPHLVRLMPHPTPQGWVNEDKCLGFIRSMGTDTLVSTDCSTPSMSQTLR